MGFLRRLVGGAEPPLPEWSPFGDGRTHQAFLDAVEADLRRRGLQYRLEVDVVLVPMDGADEPAQYGLTNLSQQCASADRAEWPRMIAAHFDHMRSVLGRDLDALSADYAQASRVLGVRLMPDESVGGPGLPHAAARPVAPGIVAVLVFDFPDSTATVDREQIDAWPVDADGAFAQGLTILDREPTPIRDDVEDGDVRFTVWYGDSFYVATWLLRLDALLPPETADALVAVPNRHTLVVHPIVDGGAIPAMQAIYQLAVQLFRDGPGSISDQPYWWHDGELVVIPHEEQGRKIAVVPPQGLVAVFEAVLARSEQP